MVVKNRDCYNTVDNPSMESLQKWFRLRRGKRDSQAPPDHAKVNLLHVADDLNDINDDKTGPKLVHTPATPSTVASNDSGNNTPLTVDSYGSDDEDNEYVVPSIIKDFNVKCTVNNHYTNSIAELEHFSIGFLMACKDNNVSLVKILADTMGVQLINMQDAEGNSGLIYSCKMGNIEVVDVLLSHGANVHLKNRYSYDALMYACELENNERVVELLLSAGANVNVFNSCKMTPLCIACKIGAAKTVKLLLKHGAVVDHPHDNGYSPLFLSSINGNYDIVGDLLIYGANVNHVNAHGYSALLFACERGHTPVVILLIQNGADINVQNSFGISGLIFATKHMFYSIVDILLCAGCDVNSCDNSGKTALMYAVRNNNRLLISALLRHHADVNIADVDGNTAFHFACSTGSVKLVNLLITADNSDLDSVNCQGNSCFMVACEFANMSVSKLLISHNINSSMQNVVGETWSDIYGSGLCKHSFALNFIVGHISALHDTIRLQSNWVRRKEFVMLLVQLGYILRDQKQLDLDTVLSKAVRQETSFLDKLLYNRTLVRLIMSYI